MSNKLDYWKELRFYLIGYALALALTLAAFALVIFDSIDLRQRMILLTIFGIVQTVVHFRYFLHIDMSKQKREDLHLILFSTVLLIIMAGGTIWIIANLATRMH